MRAETARGRFHPEPEAATRSPWQRDRDRIIHSSAFRKLQYKTQVFVNHEGDFFRTRLTHSIEVAQIARSIARALHLNEDLAEALALAHDLGHPPFGHAGEEALNVAMKPFGGFDHNAQSLRVVTLLESRYAAFDGLNLTWETLEGLAKHNGPLHRPPGYIAEYDQRHRLELAHPRLGGGAGRGAGRRHRLSQPRPRRRDARAPVRPGRHRASARGGRGARRRAAREPRRAAAAAPARDDPPRDRRLGDRSAGGDRTPDRGKLDPRDCDAIRRAKKPVVGFSPPMADAHLVIKEFLTTRMYRHWRVNRMSRKARELAEALFALLHAQPSLLPDDWRARAGEGGTARAASDRLRLRGGDDRPLRDGRAPAAHRCRRSRLILSIVAQS